MKSTLITETDKLLEGVKLDFDFDFELTGIVPKRLIIGIIFLLTLFIGTFFSCSKARADEQKGIDFVYVNGFGERRFPPAFETKMNAFLKPLGGDFNVTTHRWDSLKLDLRKVVHQWNKAKRNANSETERFAREVIESNEREKRPYVLVGYSLGSRIIAEALKIPDRKLEYLKGIYFLGSALPREYKIETKNLPDGFRIINYHSDHLDHVLKFSFYNAEGIKAGGEVGFDEDENFMNLRTVATHVYKGGPLQRDYSNLAEAIGYLSLYGENILLNKGKSNFNIELKVASGKFSWNDIYILKIDSRGYMIQQNANTKYYRGLLIDKNGKRIRKAWGRNLHAVLEGLKGEYKVNI